MSARRWSAWGWALCVDINAPTHGVEGNPFRTMPCRKFHVQRMRGQRAWINDLLDECEDCLTTLFASSIVRTEGQVCRPATSAPNQSALSCALCTTGRFGTLHGLASRAECLG